MKNILFYAMVLFVNVAFMSCNKDKNNVENPQFYSNSYLQLSDLSPLYLVPVSKAEAKLAAMGFTGGRQVDEDGVSYIYTAYDKQDTIVFELNSESLIETISYISRKEISPYKVKKWLTHIPEKVSLPKWELVVPFSKASSGCDSFEKPKMTYTAYDEYISYLDNFAYQIWGMWIRANWEVQEEDYPKDAKVGYRVGIQYAYLDNDEAQAMLSISCLHRNNSVPLGDILENGFYVVGPATAVLDMKADNLRPATMGAGINEYDKHARAGLYEKYVALEGGKEFELVYIDGGNVTHYGADLEKGAPDDVADGITIDVYKGVMVENQKMSVPNSGFYHIALDLNVNNDLPDKTIIVSPVEWELSDGTPLVASGFNKTSMTWTLAEKEYQSSDKYKYRWGHGWKMKVTPYADVNIATNLGEGMKPDGADIDITRGVWSFNLTWNLTGGAIEKGFKQDVTLVRQLEAN